MAYLLYASIFGGILTLAMIRFRLMPLPAALAEQDWVKRLHKLDGGVPYGIALAPRRAADLSRHRLDAARLIDAAASGSASSYGARTRVPHQDIFNCIWIRPVNHELTFR